MPAIVLGAHHSALGVTRSLGRAGVPVFVVGGRGDFPTWSRWGRRLELSVSEGGGPEELAAALEPLPLERAVLFPCSDLWAEAVNRLPETSLTRFLPAVPAGRPVEILLDKWLLAEEARRLGIPHPETTRVDSGEDLDRLDGGGRAFILKPRSSQRFHRAFRVKAFPVASREEAEAKLEAAAMLDIELLLQERIPGGPTSFVLVDGYMDGRGTIATLLARRRVRTFPPDFGDSTTIVSIPLAEATEPVSATRDIVRGIAYRGMFSACFKQDARDGCFTLLEVNCRPWAHIGFAAACGVDFARMAYLEAVGCPLPRALGYRVGVRRTIFMHELASLHAEWRQGSLSRFDLVRGAVRAARPYGPIDPLPGVVHAGVVGERALRRTVSRRGLPGGRCGRGHRWPRRRP